MIELPVHVFSPTVTCVIADVSRTKPNIHSSVYWLLTKKIKTNKLQKKVNLNIAKLILLSISILF